MAKKVPGHYRMVEAAEMIGLTGGDFWKRVRRRSIPAPTHRVKGYGVGYYTEADLVRVHALVTERRRKLWPVPARPIKLYL